MKIANIELSSNAVLAPIAGYSDVGFRRVCAKMGAGITYTEMVSAKGLVYGSEKTFELLHTTDEELVKAVQIFGSEPTYIRKAVEDSRLKKFDLIDINMGCPMPKIVNNNEGSALLSDPHLAMAIVRSAKSGSKPVSVKFRLGIKNGEYVARDFARYMQDAGADAITVHGRTREQMYSGRADWEEIARVVECVEIPVFANGDVFSKQDYDNILVTTKADGVMLARGALGNPMIFGEIAGNDMSGVSIREVIFEHLDTMRAFHSERYIIANFKKHMTYYMRGLNNSKNARLEAYECRDIQSLKEVVSKYFE